MISVVSSGWDHPSYPQGNALMRRAIQCMLSAFIKNSCTTNPLMYRTSMHSIKGCPKCMYLIALFISVPRWFSFHSSLPSSLNLRCILTEVSRSNLKCLFLSSYYVYDLIQFKLLWNNFLNFIHLKVWVSLIEQRLGDKIFWRFYN